MQPLAVDERISEITAALHEHGAAVLVAPPGTGKSTRVPPALAAAFAGEVVVLQPRRVAAIGVARRIADERGWELGGEVGYRIRFERRGSARTRLWFETEGLFARRLRSDPYLEGVSAVVLDEFHERSLDADLALAWCAELRRTLRADLAVLVMSATIDPAPVAEFLGAAPVFTLTGTQHPVTTALRPPRTRERIPEHCLRVIDEALATDDGDVLAFLPGVGEINRVCEGLRRHPEVEALPLHGSLPPERQSAALEPGAQRRVVVATNVAETSLTVPGVRTVVDSGWARVAHLDPDTGLDELRRERISRFSAEQRAGRAGRVEPGRCFRLWSKLEDARLAVAPVPEIRRVDLAGLVLALKQIHGDDLASFPFFEAPEPERLAAAEDLLVDLGLVSARGGPLSGRGRLVADLPLHPRLGRLVLEAGAHGALSLGARTAAILSERDVLRDRRRRAAPGPADLLDRLEAMQRASSGAAGPEVDRGVVQRVARSERQILGIAGDLGDDGGDHDPAELVARLVLAAWPDRVGRRSAPGSNSARLVGGKGITIEASSALYAATGARRAPLLVAHAVQGLAGAGAKRCVLRLGAEVDEALIEAVHPGSIRRHEQLRYDERSGKVSAAAVWRYRDLDLRYAEGIEADPAAVAECLAAALAPRARAVLASDERVADWLARLEFLRAARPEEAWPALDDEALAEVVRSACAGCRSRDELLARDLLGLVQGGCAYPVLQRIEDWAPERWEAPTGRRHRIRYADGKAVLAVRVQECLGLRETPRVAGGRVPLLLELLAPNHRPVQITDDLGGFWERTWPQVRKDLRGRYPKHAWPEDPFAG